MEDSYPRFRLAAIQAASILFDREQTTDKAVRLIEKAGQDGAAIIGFPECFIPGHPGAWFGAKKSNPLPRAGELFTKIVKNGVKIPSPTTDRICAAAKKAHAYVVMGLSELDNLYAGTLYESQIVISDVQEVGKMTSRKTAISVEAPLFEEIDAAAEEMQVSRSYLLTLAARDFLRRRKSQKLLEAINAAHKDQPDPGEERLRAQIRPKHRQLVRDQW